MTFGILDWTADNLPQVLERYRCRDPAAFSSLAGSGGIPLRGGCVDPTFACSANRSGALMCDAGFSNAFRSTLGTSSFQKAQVDMAMEQYERRLRRFAKLGLKTEFGNIAMAVVANNLRRGSECRPETWKAACASSADEPTLVRCMLNQYVAHTCRGSLRASRERVAQIERVFGKGDEGTNVHPSTDEVLACVPEWSRDG